MTRTGDPRDTKSARRAARELVSTYHEAKLAGLIEHVRDAFARYDAGGLDAFELDDVIHHYKFAASGTYAAISAGLIFAATT
jgi:hypothetical protein